MNTEVFPGKNSLDVFPSRNLDVIPRASPDVFPGLSSLEVGCISQKGLGVFPRISPDVFPGRGSLEVFLKRKLDVFPRKVWMYFPG